MRVETLLVWFVLGFCLLWDTEAAPIPPITTYRRGHKQRVEYIKAVIRRNNLNTGTGINSRTRAYSKSMSPYQKDDAGHLIAARLGGTGRETYNIVPQNLAQNRGSWRTRVESPIYNSVSAGNVVTYEVWPIYSTATATRPSSLRYLAKTSRGKVVVSGTMQNPKPSRLSSFNSFDTVIPEMETYRGPVEPIFNEKQGNQQNFNDDMVPSTLFDGVIVNL